MRTIYHAENILDANLLKGALEQQGIPAYVAGQYLTGAMGELPAMGLVAVMVPEHSLAAAQAVVEAVEAQLAEARKAVADDDDLLPASVPV
jgi:hypothetical protein